MNDEKCAGKECIRTYRGNGMKGKINIRYVLFLAITGALAGLLFGFDIAIITGAGQFLKEHFKLDELNLGWAFSSLLFGCVVGSAIAGYFADHFGRKRPLLWVAVLFGVTSAVTGLAPTFASFIVARFLGGLAVGGASILAPM
jgi:MFS family permease